MQIREKNRLAVRSLRIAYEGLNRRPLCRGLCSFAPGRLHGLFAISDQILYHGAWFLPNRWKIGA